VNKDVARFWQMLDACMVELNKSIPNRDEKLRDGTIDHIKLDREKMAGEALGIARCIAVATEEKLDHIRAEAIHRYETRAR
jgi:hypothetical protein